MKKLQFYVPFKLHGWVDKSEKLPLYALGSFRVVDVWKVFQLLAQENRLIDFDEKSFNVFLKSVFNFYEK